MNGRDRRSEYHDVAERLNRNILSLVQQILPAGVRDGRHWRVGSIAGEAGLSLAVILSGAKQGHWADFASGEQGDGLDLVGAVLCRGDQRQAFAWARNWLGMSREAPAPAKSARPAAGVDVDVSSRYAQSAERCWREARRLSRGDPVDRYLVERGICLAELGRAPNSLRYHPSLWCEQTQCAWPAMVAAIAAPNGALVAVHRTWLQVDPIPGSSPAPVTKAPIPGGAKRTLGSYRGGYVRLWRGASSKPWADIECDDVIMVGEGIEDTLTAIQTMPNYRAVCAVSLYSMLSIELPEKARNLLLLGQNDGSAAKATKLRDRVIDRWLREGRQISVEKPPVFVKDWNDLAQWYRARQSNFKVTWGSQGNVGRGTMD